jgi:hypothetical protein
MADGRVGEDKQQSAVGKMTAIERTKHNDQQYTAILPEGDPSIRLHNYD